MDEKRKLTEEVKKYAKELGANMVGIASVERFKNAPLLHSPKGLMPETKSIVVVTTIWMDAAIELTEKELSEWWWNPADVCEGSGGMASKLNPIVFNLAKFLEKKGYRSLPLPQTLYWRWRPYKTMKDPFAPPLAHRYAAVAAGLGEIGWHNSFISPKYGPRQRIVSLLTEAELVPDPLYNGEPLCDKCMECVKACPYKRFTKEVEKVVELDIGGKKFKMPRTNKWRCHLCYYEINPRFLPEKITEEVAIRIENDGRQPKIGITMDSAACLAACLPPNLRKRDKNLYPHSIARKREKKKVNSEKATEKIKEMVFEKGMDCLYIGSKEEFQKKGINLGDYMPYASSIILIGSKYCNSSIKDASWLKIIDLGYEISCYLQEDLGYYTLQLTKRLTPDDILKVFNEKKDENANYYHIITELPLKPLKIKVPTGNIKSKRKISTDELKTIAFEKKADLIGITSVERLNKVYSSLTSLFEKEKTIVVENKPERTVIGGVDINFTANGIEKVKIKKPRDYLSNAKSVIVIGIHYPYTLLEQVAKPPAENVSPYFCFVKNEHYGMLNFLVFDIVRFLKEKGYRSVLSIDLEGISFRASTSNSLPALCAGLGEIGYCGAFLTPEYGPTQSFISIITDAELEEDQIYNGDKLCKECFRCVKECPVNAISKNERTKIKIENKTYEFGKIDRLKCEWSHRFGLVGEEGPKYMGCKVNVLPPSEVTLKSFKDAMVKIKKLDIMERFNWNLTFEKCLNVCPVKGTKYLDKNKK